MTSDTPRKKVAGSDFGPDWTGKRCGAHARTTGQPCRSPAVIGKDRCRMHGGARGSGAPCGKRNGFYRHGRETYGSREIRRASSAALALASKWITARNKGSASEMDWLGQTGNAFRKLERVRAKVEAEKEIEA